MTGGKALYLVIKWLHVLSSTLLFGTGLGSAFYLYCANRTRQVAVIAAVTRHVVLADWLFTATMAVFQPLSGLYLAHNAGYPLTSGWILASAGLYILAGACWLPVVWLQIRMRTLAGAADAAGNTLPPLYWRYARYWAALGVPAFSAFIVIFYLMVARPF